LRFFINPRSGVPIYKQLIQQIEKGIAGGILKPGQKLPTVREVALELTVNPNTVARAYRELEYAGLVETVQGRGTFIVEKIGVDVVEKEMIIRGMIKDLIQQSQQLGLTSLQLKRVFLETLKDMEQGGGLDE
jgi:GntR family transcriptional regulator